MLNGSIIFCQTFHQEAIQLFRDAFAVNPALQQVLQHVANAERAVAKQPGLGGLRGLRVLGLKFQVVFASWFVDSSRFLRW